jgi:hypothetical protein
MGELYLDNIERWAIPEKQEGKAPQSQEKTTEGAPSYIPGIPGRYGSGKPSKATHPSRGHHHGRLPAGAPTKLPLLR